MTNEVLEPTKRQKEASLNIIELSNSEGRGAFFVPLYRKGHSHSGGLTEFYQPSKQQSRHGWVNRLVSIVFFLQMIILSPTFKLIQIQNRKLSTCISGFPQAGQTIGPDSGTRRHSSYRLARSFSHVCCPMFFFLPPGCQQIQERNIITFFFLPRLYYYLK